MKKYIVSKILDGGLLQGSHLDFISTFKNDNNCLFYYLDCFEDLIYICPKCNDRNPYYLNEGLYGRLKCRKCYRKYHIFTDTIFENTKIDLFIWFSAIRCVKLGYLDKSEHFAHFHGITQKSAYYIIKKIKFELKK